MPLTTVFHIKKQPSGPVEVVTCAFSDDDVSTLTAYLKYLHDITSLSIVRAPRESSLTFHFDNGETSVSTNLPHWEEVMPLLHRLRPIILEREYASFVAVSSLLRQRVNSHVFHSMLKVTRKIYDGRHQQEMVRISTRDAVLNSERVLMKWLNAYEYHRDQNLKAEVDALLSWLPDALPRFIFVSLLFEKVRGAQALAGMSELALGERKQFSALLPSGGGAALPPKFLDT